MANDSLILRWDRIMYHLTTGQTQHPSFKALAMISNKNQLNNECVYCRRLSGS